MRPHSAAGDVEAPTTRAGAAVVENSAEMTWDLLTPGGSLVRINLLRRLRARYWLLSYHKGRIEGINISAESFLENLVRSFLIINVL